MTLDLFELTAKGRKMFAEGAIPTGQEKAKTTPVFYSPVTRKFDLVCTQSYAPLETSFLSEDFLDKVKYDVSGMEGRYLPQCDCLCQLRKSNVSPPS